MSGIITVLFASITIGGYAPIHLTAEVRPWNDRLCMFNIGIYILYLYTQCVLQCVFIFKDSCSNIIT